MRILIIEDEFNLADLIQNRLKKDNYNVDISLDGLDGLYKSLTNIYDLIILDVMLPNKNGFEILSEIKKNKIESKVIMLTSRSSLDDKLAGFNEGADDYLTKPFHLEELMARINVKLRKTSNNDNKDILEFEDLILNLRNNSITNKFTNESISVVCKEFMILEYLMKNTKQVISKDMLYDKVWGIDNDSISNNLEAYLSFIRKKLKSIDSKVTIKSVRGLGYKMELQDE